MVDGVSSMMIQFADDTKLWNVIRNVRDMNELQRDLEKLEDLSDTY
jgi:hypothetical protein